MLDLFATSGKKMKFHPMKNNHTAYQTNNSHSERELNVLNEPDQFKNQFMLKLAIFINVFCNGAKDLCKSK